MRRMLASTIAMTALLALGACTGGSTGDANGGNGVGGEAAYPGQSGGAPAAATIPATPNAPPSASAAPGAANAQTVGSAGGEVTGGAGRTAAVQGAAAQDSATHATTPKPQAHSRTSAQRTTSTRHR